MNQVQVFQNQDFGQIRTVIINNEPWFVAKDISDKLGYAKTFSMTKQIDEEDRMIFDTSSQVDSNFNSKTRSVGIINESGLYTAIMKSTLKSAKKFKRWVTSEVLPQIRKTGTYSGYQLPQTTDGKIALLAQGHVELKQEIDSVKEELESLKMDLPILPIEADKITESVKKKGISVMGGKNSPAYLDRSLQHKVYSNIYSNLKYNFGVKSYKSIKRCECDRAIDIINSYQPPFFLQQIIDNANAQQRLVF